VNTEVGGDAGPDHDGALAVLPAIAADVRAGFIRQLITGMVHSAVTQWVMGRGLMLRGRFTLRSWGALAAAAEPVEKSCALGGALLAAAYWPGIGLARCGTGSRASC